METFHIRTRQSVPTFAWFWPFKFILITAYVRTLYNQNTTVVQRVGAIIAALHDAGKSLGR